MFHPSRCMIALFLLLSPVAGGCVAEEPPDDRSLTAKQYLDAGLPPYDKPWSAIEMTKAVKALTAVAGDDLGKLPRYKSERSGAIFARFLAPQNLDCLKDRTVPIQTRVLQAGTYLLAVNEINKLYLSAQAKKAIGGAEMVECAGAMLRTMVVILDLVDEFVPTLKKEDPKYAARMAGIAQMRRGIAISVVGGLAMLIEKGNYTVTERARLVACLDETLPKIVPRLAPAARDETLGILEQRVKDPALKELQPALATVQMKVREALGKK